MFTAPKHSWMRVEIRVSTHMWLEHSRGSYDMPHFFSLYIINNLYLQPNKIYNLKKKYSLFKYNQYPELLADSMTMNENEWVAGTVPVTASFVTYSRSFPNTAVLIRTKVYAHICLVNLQPQQYHASVPLLLARAFIVCGLNRGENSIIAITAWFYAVIAITKRIHMRIYPCEPRVFSSQPCL